MATTRQRKAVDKLVETRGNVSEAMRRAGYDDTTAKNPKNLTDSKAFAELCEEYGLTDELLLSALVDDIKAKKGERKAELELGFKVKGKLKEGAKVTDANGRTLMLINMEPEKDETTVNLEDK